MEACIEAADLRKIGESAVAEFDERISKIPQDLCGSFHSEAQRLETQLLTLYQMLVLFAKKADDLEKVASLWGCMVLICDGFSRKLGALANQHPYCGAESYYDRVLDLRNKCLRLQKMHS